MERDTNDTGLASDGFGAPREVTGIESESAELAVAATRADQVNTLWADTCVRWLSVVLVSLTAHSSEEVVWKCNSPALLKGTS
jgi:hypothetical protein